jgi:hypothetical protein
MIEGAEKMVGMLRHAAFKSTGQPKDIRVFFEEITIFSCGEAFPGSPCLFAKHRGTLVISV